MDSIKKIADKNSKSIGFVRKVIFEKAIEYEGIKVVEVDNSVVGFQHYYHRKRDSQTTFYQKAIDNDLRRKGLGTLLVESIFIECRSKGRTLIQLKCPENLESNDFHKALGFKLASIQHTSGRNLNIWQYSITKNI